MGRGVSPLSVQAHCLLTEKKAIDENLYLHDTMVPKTNYIRYLGVTLGRKLNWNEHVYNMTAKGNLTLGFIRRNILTNPEAIKNIAYK